MNSRDLREKVERQESEIQNLIRGQIEVKAMRETYERSLLLSDEKFDKLLTTHLEAIKAFQAVAEQYTDGLSRARQTISSLEETTTQMSQPFSNRPLHMNEEEEDLSWQLDHGVLSMTQYNEALRAAGLSD